MTRFRSLVWATAVVVGAATVMSAQGQGGQRELGVARHADQEQHHRIAAQHGEVALGEVDDVGGADDEHEAQRHQRVDAAQGEPLEQHLEVVRKRFHPRLSSLRF